MAMGRKVCGQGGRAVRGLRGPYLSHRLPDMTPELRLSPLERVSLTEVLSPLGPWERELKPVCRVWYWPQDVPTGRDSGSLAGANGTARASCPPPAPGTGPGHSLVHLL